MTDVFAKYVAPARAKPQLWRLILGLGVIGICWITTTFGLLLGGQIMMSGDGILAASHEIQDGTTPFGMAVLLLTFSGLLIGSVLAALLLHQRGLRSLTGPFRPFLADFLKVLVPVALFYVLLMAGWHVMFDPVPNLEFRIWIVMVPIGLAGVALQTLAEELAFRGYLMQQLAARFRSPVIWMGVPTLSFGLLHFTSQAGLTIGLLIVLATGTFGYVAADLTRRRGNLGAAWALHLINNSFAILFLATAGNLPGLALWLTPYGMDTPGILAITLITDIIALVVAWRISLWALGR